MNNKRYIVYCHINKINNKKYVGITNRTNPNYRWRNGLGYDGSIFGKAINKYGWENFEHIILFENLTQNDAKEKEIELIKLYNTKIPNGYNVSNGGDIGWKDSVMIYCYELDRYFNSYNEAYNFSKEDFKNKYSPNDIKECCNFNIPYLKIPWKNLYYHYQLATSTMIKDVSLVEKRCFKHIKNKQESNINKLKRGRKYHYKKINGKYKLIYVDNVCSNCGVIYRGNYSSDKGMCEKCKTNKISILKNL